MMDDERILAVIAGRGGSKGLPRKNLLDLGGKPLIAWSIEAAAQSKLLDRTIVSTDDSEIAAVARASGGDVPFLRPAELASDTAPIIDTILHAVDTIGETFGYVMLLQATSPLRSAADIDGALAHCSDCKAPACVSVVADSKAHWSVGMDAQGRLLLPPAISTRRQDLPAAYQPNGAIYFAKLDWLRRTRDFYSPETVGYVMPPERSIDIDTRLDFAIAEALLKVR